MLTIQYIENNLAGKKILSLHATKSAFVAMNDKYMIVPWGHTTVGGKMSSYAFEKENGWAGESSASTISKTIFTNSYTVFVMAQIPGENTRDAWRDKKHSSLGSNYMFWGLHNDEDPNVMYNILTGTYEANVTAKNRLSSKFYYVRKVHVAVGNDIDAFLLEATVGDEKASY